MIKKALIAMFLCLIVVTQADTKVYIDVHAPISKPLPIAVQRFTDASEISDVIRTDLNYTGIIQCIDDDMQIEKNEQDFNSNSWRSLGVVLVVKGRLTTNGLVITVHDVLEARAVIQKQYSFPKGRERELAHHIANDIYYLLTGQKGIFTSEIAFVLRRNNQREIYLMNWDGSNIRPLGISAGIIMSPKWSPDGSKLIYSAESNRQWGVFIYDFKTAKERNIVSLEGTTVSGNFLPNGREFVFSSTKDGRSNVYIGDLSTGKGMRLIASAWIDTSPTVSPDGTAVAFVSNRSGSPQIYVADIRGDGVRRLTFEGSYNTSPAWSPKGDKIAFVRMTPNGNQIFVMKSDGSSVTQLTNTGINEDPSFSPDGNFITFTSTRGGQRGIFIMRADGSAQMRLTPVNMAASLPSWSPLR